MCLLLIFRAIPLVLQQSTVYPKKYAHGFCFAVLCCGYTLTDFPISIRLTSLALWQSNDCPSASKATLMNMDKHFMWIHYERLHNHNKAKHNKTVCIFLGIYCMSVPICEAVRYGMGVINIKQQIVDMMHSHWEYWELFWTVLETQSIAIEIFYVLYIRNIYFSKILF